MAAAAEPSESIEDLVARKDLTRMVERAMAKLPEEQRTAIVLKEYHGLTFQEIADLVGCPLSTVKTRLYQGLDGAAARAGHHRRPNGLNMSDTFCGYDGKRDEAIVAYIYGEMAANERTAFVRHLSRCRTCRHELEALGELRAELAMWSPPDHGSLANRVENERPRPAAAPNPSEAPSPSGSPDGWSTWLPRRRSRDPALWRSIPAWAQFAAATLFLGMAAGIANLDITYNRDGLTVHTGWSTGHPALVDQNVASEPVATQADLQVLAEQLRAELQTTAAVSAPAPAAAEGTNETELIRRVRALIKDSEQRQQRELALRVAEVAQDAQVQRQADLVRIDRTLGALQSTTGTAVRRQEQLLNNLAVRVSQRQ